MANETTTTAANDVFFSAWVDDMIIDEIRPHNVSRQFFRYRARQASNSYDFPLQADPGAAAASTEGTGLSNTQLTTDKATATVGTVGQMATVTDELAAISLIDAYQHFGAVLGRSVAEKYETDMTALMDDFANTTGVSGQDYTLAQMQEAAAQLVQRDATGQLVQVIHGVQWGDLQQDLLTSGGAYWGNDQARIGGLDATTLDGYQGAPLGIPTYITSLIPTANAGADRAGAIFVADLALGLYEIWGPRTETDRDISMPGTEVVVTARYGVVEVRDVFGESVITDA